MTSSRVVMVIYWRIIWNITSTINQGGPVSCTSSYLNPAQSPWNSHEIPMVSSCRTWWWWSQSSPWTAALMVYCMAWGIIPLNVQNNGMISDNVCGAKEKISSIHSDWWIMIDDNWFKICGRLKRKRYPKVWSFWSVCFFPMRIARTEGIPSFQTHVAYTCCIHIITYT